MESGLLEQENIAEAVALGVLTGEQAREMGFVFDDPKTEEELSKDGEGLLSEDEVTTDTL